MRKPYFIGLVGGCGLCAMAIALAPPAGPARAEQPAPATTRSTRTASLEERVESLERAVAVREQAQPSSSPSSSSSPSLAERVRQLERRLGTFARSLAQESLPATLDPEQIRRSVEALERSTRGIETRLASLERAQRGNPLDRPSQDLLELERTIDRLVARVDDLDLRVRRLERSTEW
jgi:hypothetical protein